MKISPLRGLFFAQIVLLFAACAAQDENDSKTQLSGEQVSLTVVRGTGDYLKITDLETGAVISVKDSNNAEIAGTSRKFTNYIQFIFTDNLSAGEELYVYAKEPDKEISDPVVLEAGEEPLLFDLEHAARKLSWSGNTAEVHFDSLQSNNIYLLKVNTQESAVPAADTGTVKDYHEVQENTLKKSSMPQNDALRRIRNFNSRVPAKSVQSVNEGQGRSAVSAQTASVSVGATKKFWMESYYGSGNWEQKDATVRAAGTYCNVWVMDSNYNSSSLFDRKITSTQAETLAAKFDEIYPIETNLLGYEYGGGSLGDGGVDLDKKIQILVCDILNQSGVPCAAGYFWSKDYYTDAELAGFGYNNLKSNRAEMFYIDAGQFEQSPDYIYTTLVHEFQHMINWNAKAVKWNKASSAWFDEMLSMMAEDVISPLIGVGIENDKHPVKKYVPLFLEDSFYDKGITEGWGEDDNPGDSDYARVFIYGAYLMRNYGGASFVSKLLENSQVDDKAISQALKDLAYKQATFQTSISRFGEAFVFSGACIPDGAMSFDITVEKTINSVKYTVYAFDIFKYETGGRYGPALKDLSQYELHPVFALLQGTEQWRNLTGAYSITVEKPAGSNVELYLMVR